MLGEALQYETTLLPGTLLGSQCLTCGGSSLYSNYNTTTVSESALMVLSAESYFAVLSDVLSKGLDALRELSSTKTASHDRTKTLASVEKMLRQQMRRSGSADLQKLLEPILCDEFAVCQAVPCPC